MEIQKIKNLEELDQLEVGSTILLQGLGDRKPKERTYLGKKDNLNYSFLELENTTNMSISELEINGENILFLKSGELLGRVKRNIYLSGTEEYNQKLNIMNGGK